MVGELVCLCYVVKTAKNIDEIDGRHSQFDRKIYVFNSSFTSVGVLSSCVGYGCWWARFRWLLLAVLYYINR